MSKLLTRERTQTLRRSWRWLVEASVLALLFLAWPLPSIVQGQPKSADDWLNQSLTHYRARDFKSATSAARKAIELTPNSAAGYINLCAAALAQRSWDEAVTAGEAAVRLDPKSQLAKNNLAAALRQQKQQKGEPPRPAIPNAQPTFDDILNRSVELIQASKFEESIKVGNEALKLRPDAAVIFNNICFAHVQLKQWDLAIAAGEKAVSLDPASPLARNNLALARRNKNPGTRSPLLAIILVLSACVALAFCIDDFAIEPETGDAQTRSAGSDGTTEAQ